MSLVQLRVLLELQMYAMAMDVSKLFHHQLDVHVMRGGLVQIVKLHVPGAILIHVRVKERVLTIVVVMVNVHVMKVSMDQHANLLVVLLQLFQA